MTISAPEFIHETVLLKETVASVLNVTVAELETGIIKKTGMVRKKLPSIFLLTR